MQLPATQDTILAVASPWRPSPVGIIRLSGPRAFEIVDAVIAAAPSGLRPAAPRRGVTASHVAPLPDVTLPADIFRFPAPASSTGQDVAEIHAPGSLPLLRALLDRLVVAGARRALPGEFTARAYVNRKIDAAGAASVLELIHATDAISARAALRLARGTTAEAADIQRRLLALLARVEADIDFVDEEDVAALSAAQAREAIAAIADAVHRLSAARALESRHRRPHVALAGLPNAGKSTLFNAFLGRRRAIVAPVEGTTRDVLSAEIDLAGREIVLQDCAGLGGSRDDLELAAHRAAEQAADLADAIIWVHDSSHPWTDSERAALQRLDPARVVIALSKSDESGQHSPHPAEGIPICAPRGEGLPRLRAAVAARLAAAPEFAAPGPDWPAVFAALGRASVADSPELVALDLRAALQELRSADQQPLDEDVLGFIFTQFCIGK